MGAELLVKEQIEAGEDFVQEFNDYVPVVAAFWVNTAESDEWFLYIASDEIDDHNIDVAYGEVLRRLGSRSSQWLHPFRVKLVNSHDPTAREAMAIRDRYPVKTPTHYHGTSLGGMSIDGAYIYAPLSTTKSMP